MAKVHTVEWTPAILAHPALQLGMNANWWGLIGEKLTKLLGRIGHNEVFNGIPGSGVDQDGVSEFRCNTTLARSPYERATTCVLRPHAIALSLALQMRSAKVMAAPSCQVSTVETILMHTPSLYLNSSFVCLNESCRLNIC